MKHDTPDFSVPQRQSAAAIVILIAKSGVQIAKSLWPILLVTLLRSKKGSSPDKYLYIIIGFAALSVGYAIIRFLFYRYYIQNNSLVIQTGWLQKKTLSIPLQSIQAVHLEQNLWQQAFGVSKVTFDSAGTEKVEAKMEAINVYTAEQLKQVLLQYKITTDTAEGRDAARPPVQYNLTIVDLLKLSLSANHLEAFLILFVLSINILDDLRKAFEFDGWGWMESIFGDMKDNMVALFSVVILLVVVVSVGFSVIRVFIKYYDFKMDSGGHQWRVSFGLFNRQQRIIPIPKIQLFSWHANYVRRKINFWMLDLKTLGDEKVQPKQRLKIPLTGFQSAVNIAASYQQSPVFDPAQGAGIEPAYWQRRTLMVSLPVTIFVAAFAAIWLQWQALCLLALLPVWALQNFMRYQNFKWFANHEGVQLHKGLWGREYKLLVWKKIQQVSYAQSPYQRRHQLATLQFTTAAGAVTLPYLPLEVCRRMVNGVLYTVESANEKWM